MRRKAQVGIVVFFILILLIIAIVFLVIFLHGKDEPKAVVLNESLVNKTYWNITLYSNAVSKVSYILSNDSQVLSRGSIFPTVEERFYNVEANKSVYLESFSGEYYYNKTTCNITRNMFKCKVNLLKKANNYSITLTNDSITVDPNGYGSLQSPVKLCFSWKESVSNVILPDLKSASIPSGYDKLVDACFVVPYNINMASQWSLDVHKNQFYTSDEKKLLLVRVFDYEKSGFSQIGVKESGILV